MGQQQQQQRKKTRSISTNNYKTATVAISTCYPHIFNSLAHLCNV